MSDIEQLVAQATAEFSGIEDASALEQAKARFLGKSGSITELLKGLGKLDPEARKTAGAAINSAKERIEAALNARREALRHAALEAQLKAEALDITLPGSAAKGTLPFLMYPNGENASGRFDEVSPDSFKYTIAAREIR